MSRKTRHLKNAPQANESGCVLTRPRHRQVQQHSGPWLPKVGSGPMPGCAASAGQHDSGCRLRVAEYVDAGDDVGIRGGERELVCSFGLTACLNSAEHNKESVEKRSEEDTGETSRAACSSSAVAALAPKHASKLSTSGDTRYWVPYLVLCHWDPC
jgi:hypothetical protein